MAPNPGHVRKNLDSPPESLALNIFVLSLFFFFFPPLPLSTFFFIELWKKQESRTTRLSPFFEVPKFRRSPFPYL